MTNTTQHEAILMLEDGLVLKGKSIGKIGTTGGELCFNTGMTGYQEIYTDPSYFGQLIINTTAHIGNYGVATKEQESGKVQFAGLICGQFSKVYSRASAYQSLGQYLTGAGIVGIADVDTRRLVRHIRSKGAMNAVISSEFSDVDVLAKHLSTVPNMDHLELSSKVTTDEVHFYGDPMAKWKVSVLDLGIKTNILRNLAARGMYMQVFPAKTSFADMMAWHPDGIFISNGPGDPASMDYAVNTVKLALEADKPLFGICLGHQILARACGISTFKMHHGHRGLNHPVKNLITGRSEITSQNHGFAVSLEDIQNHPDLQLTHINLNDNSVEGIRLKNKPAFSVQYHPEASPGPHDSVYLFEEFEKLLK
jgi:carbamoyl-phosphate synthase small subunit